MPSMVRSNSDDVVTQNLPDEVVVPEEFVTEKSPLVALAGIVTESCV